MEKGAVKLVPPLSLSACVEINQSRRNGDLCRKETAATALESCVV